MVVTALQLVPPLVELKAPTALSLALSIGTITVPSGRTTGCPPMTPVLLVAGALHALPPLVEVLAPTGRMNYDGIGPGRAAICRLADKHRGTCGPFERK